MQGAAGDLKTAQGRSDEHRWAWWEHNDVYLQETGDHLAGEVIAAVGAGLQDCADGLHCAIAEIQLPLMPLPSRDQLMREASKQSDPAASFEERFPVIWAQRQIRVLDEGDRLPACAAVLLQLISVGPGLRIVALEGEPVAGLGWLIHQQFDHGVTFALGYSNGDALYLPCDKMLPEGGYEVESFKEYGYASPLASGIDDLIRQTLCGMRQTISCKKL